MARKVLVLNQDYSALTTCNVTRAFLLVYMNKAELVSSAKDLYLRTITQSFPMPSVIRLHAYIRLPYRGVVLSRQNVFKRDRHTCQYCGSIADLTLDHVLPRSRGGKTVWDNLVTACKPCNSRKGDYTPEEANIALQTTPFKPSFLMFIRDFGGKMEEEWMPFLTAQVKYS